MKHVKIYEDFNILQEKKWIQKAIKSKGSLHKSLGIPMDDNIPMETIDSKISELKKEKKEGKAKAQEEGKNFKLTKDKKKLLKRLNLAKTLKNISK